MPRRENLAPKGEIKGVICYKKLQILALLLSPSLQKRLDTRRMSEDHSHFSFLWEILLTSFLFHQGMSLPAARLALLGQIPTSWPSELAEHLMKNTAICVSLSSLTT